MAYSGLGNLAIEEMRLNMYTIQGLFKGEANVWKLVLRKNSF